MVDNHWLVLTQRFSLEKSRALCFLTFTANNVLKVFLLLRCLVLLHTELGAEVFRCLTVDLRKHLSSLLDVLLHILK